MMMYRSVLELEYSFHNDKRLNLHSAALTAEAIYDVLNGAGYVSAAISISRRSTDSL